MIEKQLVNINEVDGFFHDPEWYKPLLFGENLYMNVTYLLPETKMVIGSKKEKETEMPERVIYMLEGKLEVTHGEDKFEITPEMAFLVPLESGEPFEIKNFGENMASFIMIFSPPPHPELKIKSRAQLRKLYEEHNRVVKSPEEMETFKAKVASKNKK
ncbi:MAG: cupin domain-containing protein [Methanosarcinales archaeon]|jgi:mannose-6-phosphate isomerase-like protein (cupin superfamily)|nr:cupin domain-containing protein [Methanosarcinales archaeon]